MNKNIYLLLNGDVKSNLYECHHTNAKDQRRRYTKGPKKGNIILQPEVVVPKQYYEFSQCKTCALEAKKVLDRNDLFLYSKDTTIYSKSKNYILATKTFVYKLSKEKNNHLYENYEKDNRLKLMFDIDYDIPKDEIFNKKVLNSMILSTIKYANKVIKKYTKVKPEIIVLDSSRADKYSSHIIYNNIFLNSFEHIKFLLSQNPEDKVTIDMSIYKVGSLRMLWNSKAKNNIPLEYYGNMNYKRPSNKQLFLDCLVCNITDNCELLDIQLPVIEKIPKKVKEYNIEFNDDNREYSIEELKKYVNLLDSKRAIEYDNWLNVGMALYKCNSSEDCCRLWFEFSKKKKNHASFNELSYRWSTFRTDRTYNFYSLLKWAIKDSPDKFPYLKGIEKPNYKAINIKQKYLLDLNQDIKFCTDKMSNILHTIFMDKKDHVLCIKSPYNTGKTSLLEKILTEYNPIRCLIITHRVSLSDSIAGRFKKYGFISYEEKNYFANKLIIQLESIQKTINNYDQITKHNKIRCEIPKYDLVILDECESLLNQFYSSTVKNPSETYSIVEAIIRESNKIIMLDGDFHNRSYCFAKSLGKDITIIENTIKKCKDEYYFYKDINNFDKMIDNDIKAGKNVVIMSMSSNLAKNYRKKYDYLDPKPILHCADTAKDNKIILKNVNEEWKTRLLIYSPTVESGVDFTVPHFDSRYVILSNGSCSPRALLQMIGRIRNPKSNKVCVYQNTLLYNKKVHFHQYMNVKNEIYDRYKSHARKIEIIKDQETGKNIFEFKYEEDNYINILAYNKQEDMNKNPYSFIALFLEYLDQKGCKYKFMAHKQTKKLVPNEYIKEVSEARNIFTEEAERMQILKCNFQLEEKDNYALDKYYMKKFWFRDIGHFRSEDEFMFIDDWDHLEKDINYDFVKKYYKKEYRMYNLRILLDKQDCDEIQYNKILRQYNINLKKAHKNDQLEAVKKLVTLFGFDYEVLKEYQSNNRKEMYKKLTKTKIITRPVFLANIMEHKDSYVLFKNTYDCVKKFKTDKDGLDIIKPFMGYMNSEILKHFGLEICSFDKKIKKSRQFVYYLDIDKEYYQFL